jgi:hypothetical protein
MICLIRDDIRFVGRFRTRDFLARRCAWRQVWSMNEGIDAVFDFIWGNKN